MQSPIYLQNYLELCIRVFLAPQDTHTHTHTLLPLLFATSGAANTGPLWKFGGLVAPCDFMPAAGSSQTHRHTFCHSAGNNRAFVSAAGLASDSPLSEAPPDRDSTPLPAREQSVFIMTQPPPRPVLVMPRPLPVDPGNLSCPCMVRVVFFRRLCEELGKENKRLPKVYGGNFDVHFIECRQKYISTFGEEGFI